LEDGVARVVGEVHRGTRVAVETTT
jgi:hypothetical protein